MNLDLALWNDTKKQERIMDIGINDKFIFIQIPKTGSTTIIQELIKNNLTTKTKCYRHEGIAYIQQLYENKNIPVYAMVRNPYRIVLSYFFHLINYKELYLDKNNIILEFREWCKDCIPHKYKLLELGNHLFQNKLLETDNPIVKEKIHVFKFENGVNYFIEYLNTYHDLSLNITSHTNKNEISEYKDIPFLDFFDQFTINLIKSEFKLQFDLYRYSYNIEEA